MSAQTSTVQLISEVLEGFGRATTTPLSIASATDNWSDGDAARASRDAVSAIQGWAAMVSKVAAKFSLPVAAYSALDDVLRVQNKFTQGEPITDEDISSVISSLGSVAVAIAPLTPPPIGLALLAAGVATSAIFGVAALAKNSAQSTVIADAIGQMASTLDVLGMVSAAPWFTDLTPENVGTWPNLINLRSSLQAVDPQISMSTLATLVKSATSADPGDASIVALANQLSKVFLGENVHTPAATLDEANSRIAQMEATVLFTQATGTLGVWALDWANAATLASNALSGGQNAIAYRYALRELNPFVVVGDSSIYAQHNMDGNLDLANWDPAYTEARAGMLAALVAANLADSPGEGSSVYYDEATGTTVRGSGTDIRVTFADASQDPITGVSVTGISTADHIFGTGNNTDVFHGMGGDDRLYGGAGNDILTGGEGSDQLYGGTGDDWLGFLAQGFDQADQAEIGVAGAAGNTYDGGTGNDVINGSAGYDTYVFRKGDGRDFVITNGGADILKLQSSTELPIATADVSFARQGYDLLVWIGEPGAELSDSVRVQNWFSAANSPSQFGLVGLYAADGTAIRSWLPSEITTLALTVHGLDDPLAPDNLVGLGGFSNSLYGHAGNDTLAGTSVTGYTGSGDKYVGGLGNDTLIGTNVSDRYVYAVGDGNDAIYESAGTGDVLQLMGIASTQMTVSRQGYDLRIAFTAGDGGAVDIKNWYLGSTYKVESFEFTDKTMTAIQVEALNAYQVGTENADTLTAVSGVASQMFGLGGNDTLNGGSLADVIDGGEGNDILYGYYGGDTLRGGAGDDTLYAGLLSGNTDNAGNTFIGGTGNDRLYGAAYGDAYLFDQGDGQDTIGEYQTSAAGAVDILRFGEGISAADIQIIRSGSNLVLKHVNSTDQVTLNSWYSSTGSQYKIEQVQFADGTVWDTAYLTATGLVVSGTEGADTLTGAGGWENQLYGLGGNDTLTGAELADVLEGGDGDDTIYGAYGNDTLIGGAGNDVIRGGRSDGYDNAGNTFIGGAGNDNLYGYAYGDTYIFNLGDGQDAIGEYYASATGTQDILQFGDGIAAADIRVTRVGSNLVLKQANGVDQVTLNGWYSYTDGRSKIEQVIFADGTVWDTAHLTAIGLAVSGTEGSDTLTGAGGWANQLYGLGGNDTLTGAELADVIDGGDGDDTIYGAYGGDTLIGGAGNDVIRGGRSDGYDNAGNTFIGGTGNDSLTGYSYGDTYVFNLGDGQDSISEYYASATGTQDILQFGAGITATSIQVIRSGSNLVLKRANSVDQVTINGWYSYTDGRGKLEQVTFADGTAWDTAYLTAIGLAVSGTEGTDTLTGVNGWANQLYGMGGNDTLTGGDTSDVIEGGNGNDTIYGAYGSDTLIGGAGNDTIRSGTSAGYDNAGNALIGGAGDDTLFGSSYSDTYIYNRGDGIDTVWDMPVLPGVTDILRLGEGVTLTGARIIRSDYHLVLRFSDTEKILIGGWYSGNPATPRIDKLEFADGASMLGTELESLVTEIWGMAASETLTCTGNVHTLVGRGGNDTLNGSLLEDYFRFNLGDGQDTVNTGDTAGHDILVFEDSFAATTLTASKSGDNLLLTAGSGDKVTMTGWFTAGNQATIQLPGENNLVSAATITNFLTTEGNPNALRIL